MVLESGILARLHGSLPDRLSLLSLQIAWTRVCLHAVSRHFLSDVNRNWNVRTNFSEIHNFRFHENLCSGSQVETCGQTDMATSIRACYQILIANATWKRENFTADDRDFWSSQIARSRLVCACAVTRHTSQIWRPRQLTSI